WGAEFSHYGHRILVELPHVAVTAAPEETPTIDSVPKQRCSGCRRTLPLSFSAKEQWLEGPRVCAVQVDGPREDRRSGRRTLPAKRILYYHLSDARGGPGHR
ncbi:hypothetical protein E4U61_003720, partial [Claviceps capensis]